MLNAVRIAVGQHSAVRTYTAMIRDGEYESKRAEAGDGFRNASL